MPVGLQSSVTGSDAYVRTLATFASPFLLVLSSWTIPILNTGLESHSSRVWFSDIGGVHATTGWLTPAESSLPLLRAV